MCMKVFALQRCLAQANGGCDKYYAEHVDDRECNKTMHGGLPRAGPCPVVWAGFEPEVSTRVTRHTWFDSHRKGLCPSCLRAADAARALAGAERERRGEFSDRVQALLRQAEHRAQLNEGAFMHRCYNEMWDAARNLVGGLGRKADAVWEAIEAALYGHFGVEGMARPEVQGLICTLQDAKTALVGHVKTTTREMAVALVGPKDDWDEDEGAAKFAEEDRRRMREAAERAAMAGLEARRRNQGSGL